MNKNEGVVVYIKSEFNYKHSIVSLGNTKILELIIKYKNIENICISAIYKSPSINELDFITSLERYLSQKKKLHSHILVGDININLFDEKDYVEHYKNILASFNFNSYINKITRPRSGTCIDHFFVKCSTEISRRIKSFIFEHDITDHYPIAISLPREVNKPKNNLCKSKYYTNYTSLKEDLRKESWNDIYTEKNSNKAFQIFMRKLTLYIDKNNKKVEIIKSKNTHFIKEWMTSGLLKSINIKNKLYNKLKLHPTNQELKDNYNNYKNKIRSLITTAKKNYIKREFNKNKETSSSLWKCINKICGKTQKNKDINTIKTEEGHVYTDKLKIANALNDHYCTVAEKLAVKISSTNNTCDINRLENSLYLRQTCEDEIINIIKNLKNKKAPGYDNISSDIIKIISGDISKPLTFLINYCIESGCFPDCLKVGVIKPLYKGGDKEHIGNYRPISILSVFSKIFETVIKKRLLKFFLKFNIISKNQFGFLEGKSTQDAVHALTSSIYDALDSGHRSLCIFVDLAKAFDTVNHKILLDKLERYGIRGNSLSILKSYLKNRSQYVNLGDINSKPGRIEHGVPQGTVLGPLLFVIYINDLLTINTKAEIFSYADDTAIFYKSNSWSNLKRLAEEDFQTINTWFIKNKLTLNYDKTKYISFSIYKNNEPDWDRLQITNNNVIPECDFIKYLGVTIDKHLKWNIHINNVTKKLRGLLPKFNYLKSFLDVKQLRILYSSLVQSHLTYGILGWGGAAECHLKSLYSVQKWFIKIIYNKKKTFSSNVLFKQAHLLDIRQLYCLDVLKFIYQGKISIEHVDHEYETRHKAFYPSLCSKTVGQRSSKFFAPRLYNILPTFLKDVKSYSGFKKGVCKWMVDRGRDIFNDLVNLKYTK